MLTRTLALRVPSSTCRCQRFLLHGLRISLVKLQYGLRTSDQCWQRFGRAAFRRLSGSGPAVGPLRVGKDPGCWNFSPEWMGTQEGGWGRTAGDKEFQAQSAHGNGTVWVTSHPASEEDTVPLQASHPEADVCYSPTAASASTMQFQEWRVLRFNEDTRQSVARVVVTKDLQSGETSVMQRSDCMAFLYMKTLAAAVASVVGLAGEGSSLRAAMSFVPAGEMWHAGSPACRVLCIGLGGGTLPLFLQHHFPGMQVDVVEIDPIVLAAAEEAMGFPRHRRRMQVHAADALDWLREHLAASGPPFDLICVDAFDGNNDIPTAFTDPEGPFLSSLGAALHPQHGVVCVNVHSGEQPSSWERLALWLAGSQWLDPFVTPIAQVYRHAIIPDGNGRAYMLGVGQQYNTIVVLARGQHLAQMKNLHSRLQEAADAVSSQAKFRFNVARRACLNLQEVPSQQ